MQLSGVNLTHIVINEHGPIFADVIELLRDALGRLGHSVRATVNGFVPDRLNILVGHTVFLRPSDFAAIRSSGAAYVVFQTEPLDDRVGYAPRQPEYLDFLSKAPQIWDYSPANLPFLARLGCRDVRHIPLGYAAGLERITPATEKDTDVLFYGALIPRRNVILTALHARGVRVKVLHGAYGPSRDREIARAKAILNVHQFDTPHLEEIRVAFLLNNRCFVVSETSDRNPYGEGVAFCDYAALVDCCVTFLQPGMQSERERIAEAGYGALKRIPMVENIRSALAECGVVGKASV
jgi:hypothetical protein